MASKTNFFVNCRDSGAYLHDVPGRHSQIHLHDSPTGFNINIHSSRYSSMAGSSIAKDEAFGIVPILNHNGSYQFLLIQHHAGHWGFPKGHADPGESAVQAACREFAEETGITDYTLIDGVTFSEQYSFTRHHQKFEKTVLYYPAFVQSESVTCQPEEIRSFTWLPYEQALQRLTFEGAQRVLTEVHQYLSYRR